jgi:hypothetical protein
VRYQDCDAVIREADPMDIDTFREHLFNALADYDSWDADISIRNNDVEVDFGEGVCYELHMRHIKRIGDRDKA